MMISRVELEHATPRSKVLFRSFGGPTLREYFFYVPASAVPGAPVLVAVHGITRRAAEQVFQFRDEAERAGVVLLAPYFPKLIYGQYQQVVDASGTRADLALLDMLTDIHHCAGCQTEKVHLFGYSGGAQFAHRFAMIHPQKVASLCPASAGWYTMPDPDNPYPYGIGTHPVEGMAFDLEALLSVERHVFVGSEDTQRDSAFRTTRRLDRAQGRNRIERARSWFEAMAAAEQRSGVSTISSFEIVRGVGHSFAGSARRRSLTRKVFDAIRLGQD